MASNDVHFSISCDSSNAQYSINNVYKQLDTLYDKSARVGKSISKANADAVSIVNEQYKHINKSDTVKRANTSIEAFGRQIKALRIHGLDPLTNSFARFINVAGGSFFNVFTLGVTAIMGVVVALKTVNKYLQEFYGAISARADTLIKLSKHSIDNMSKEKKEIQGIVDELTKLNQKQKLSTAQQVRAVNLAQQLKLKWSGVNVQIDKATGRITNLNQLQAQLNRQNITKTSEELQKIVEQQNTKLDLQLSKYTGKTDIFRGGVRGQNPFQSYGVFRGKRIEDITIFDLFPGLINNFDDAEAIKKIDIKKLIFGNTDDQIGFFRQIASHLTNLDAFNELNQIIDTLIQKSNTLKQLDAVADPSKETARKIEDVAKSIGTAQDILDSALRKKSSWIDAANKLKQQLDYDKMSTDEKIDTQKKLAAATDAQYHRLNRESTEIIQRIMSDPDFYDTGAKDDSGKAIYGSHTLDKITSENEKVAQLYRDYLDVQKKFQPQIEKFREQQAIYQKNKKIVDNYQLRKSWNPGFITTMTDQQKAAKEYVQSFAQDYYDVWWSGIVEAMKKQKEKMREKVNLSANDQTLNKRVDEIMTTFLKNQQELRRAEQIQEQIAELQRRGAQITNQLIKLDKQQKEQWLQELNDEFSQLQEAVREYEQRRKDVKNKQDFVDSFAKGILGKYYQDNGMQMLWRRKELQRQWKEQFGVTELSKNQKSLIGRLAYIEQLQKAGELNQNETFKYGVKTNELAARGGWASSVYVSGKDNVMQQNLKTNQNQEKILEQINKALPELRREIETLNSSLKI